MNIGFIGLGIMGKPMAKNLLPKNPPPPPPPPPPNRRMVQ